MSGGRELAPSLSAIGRSRTLRLAAVSAGYSVLHHAGSVIAGLWWRGDRVWTAGWGPALHEWSADTGEEIRIRPREPAARRGATSWFPGGE